MNRDLRTLVDAEDGVVSRAGALAAAPHHVLDHAARTGQLVRSHPGVYADPARWAEPRTRLRAALCYAGPDAALSHLTALAGWRLPGGRLDGPVHVLVPADTQRRWGGAGIRVHRRRGFTVDGPVVVIRSGLPITRVEVAVVDSWSWLPTDARRAAVIAAVGDHRTTAERLRAVVGGNLNLPGRPAAPAGTHQQLTGSPELVQAQVRAIVAARLPAPGLGDPLRWSPHPTDRAR